ncbi:PREDICTED: protein asteroid homolog 1-like [Amphimedon queenslandica]|uniref:Asteroid domain-containing protein n=1 Tax=Amphimedon queenslandica TaxID=400682 RepID=A0A1X7VNP1_AMPQE|nr:PREDICTED: protein asteroid homolog 1-like [Amphimedon queenslandica]|eukprot:XP_011409185.1 PREDICTED: protein asteroid homolog 1-like [Amphimedon queenslandica]
MIRGLSSYIDSLSSGTHWRDAKLSKCPIVLDGKCLSHNLPGDFDWKFGGQYLAIRDSLENLIKALLAQNVSPIHVVFDGVYQTDKMDMLKGRRQEIHNTIRKKLLGQDLDEHQEMNPRPPLVANTFHKVLKNYQSEGVRVYPADGDCYPLAVSLANTYDCYLVGESSDYFITPLQKGYIPLSKLAWSQPGSPVMGRVFKRDSFIASLNFEPDLIYAIPALVGNATLPNLVDETELISLVRDNPRYRGKLSEVTIKFLQEKCDCELIGLKGQILSLANGLEVLQKFEQSFEKAKKKYDVNNPTFNYEEFKMSIAYRSDNWKSIPQWIVQQYKEFMFSPSLLAVFISGVNLLHVIPDDCTKPASMIISRPIRLVIYALLRKGRYVTEIIRQESKLIEDQIHLSGHSDPMEIEEMKLEPKEKRCNRMYEILMCSSHALSLLEEEWHLPVASVIFWAKSVAIPRGDIYLKALVLSFTKCFYKSAAPCTPAFSLEALHLYAQWQCVYHDAILLNQVLALPLPYLSPADLFDGKLVTYYSQKSNDEFDMILANTSRQVLQLYTKILKTVYDNI